MAITLTECVPRIAGVRVAVTGGAGFIGSHLVDFLIGQGANQVVLIDDLSRPREDWWRARESCCRIKFVKATVLDEKQMESVLAGVQVVFHLAAISRVMDAVRSPAHAFAVNALGTVRILEAAHRAHVRRMVFCSSREVYGDPTCLPVSEAAPLLPRNVYGASKAAAEMYLGAVDPRAVEVVILRLANVYGPGDRDRVIPTFAASALQGGPLVLYGSDKELDFVWIGDVVEVLTKAGFSSAPVLEPTNVGSGSAISLRSLAERILRLVGNSAGIQVVPARGPEVERFQADIRRAVRYFGLRAQEDPLSHLPEVLTYGPLVNRST